MAIWKWINLWIDILNWKIVLGKIFPSKIADFLSYAVSSSTNTTFYLFLPKRIPPFYEYRLYAGFENKIILRETAARRCSSK